MKLDISAVHYELSEKLEAYVTRKCHRLETYIPRAARESAHVVVRVKQAGGKGAPKRTCDITLHLPHENLQASETTQHMYAAVDIAVAHVQHQLAEYKARHGRMTLRQQLRRRFRRSSEP